MKKGDLSINIIIVAIIALLVLVIISVVFSVNIADWLHGIKDCSKVKGSCDQGFECYEGYMQHPSAVCYDEDGKTDPNNICCIKIEEGAEEY